MSHSRRGTHYKCLVILTSLLFLILISMAMSYYAVRFSSLKLHAHIALLSLIVTLCPGYICRVGAQSEQVEPDGSR